MKLLQRRWRAGLKTSSQPALLENRKVIWKRFSTALCVWDQSIFITDMVDGLDSVYIKFVYLEIWKVSKCCWKTKLEFHMMLAKWGNYGKTGGDELIGLRAHFCTFIGIDSFTTTD